MTNHKFDRVIHIVESMLSKPVWQETFLLRWAHDRIEDKLNNYREADLDTAPQYHESTNRVPVFVEIYQKDLGIITLSRVISSLGDRAFGRNVFKSYEFARSNSEQNQRLQKNIAYIEVLVIAEKIESESSDGAIKLAAGSILQSNVKGAWFRDVYYEYDHSKRMFVRK